MEAHLVYSAVSFAIRDETKTEYDLQVANMKAYAGEPNYRMGSDEGTRYTCRFNH